MAATAPLISLEAIDITMLDAFTNTPTDAVNHPLTNVADRVHPLRTFRTIAGGFGHISFEIPSGTVLGAIFVDNMNFSKYDITARDSAGASTETLAGGVGIIKDDRTGRHKSYFDLTENGFTAGVTFNGTTYDHIRLTQSSSSVIVKPVFDSAGITVSDWGAVTAIEFGKQLEFPGEYINDMQFDFFSPEAVNKFLGGSEEPIEVGENYVEITIPTRDFLVPDSNISGQETTLLDIIRNRTSPIVFFENNGKREKAYTTRLVSAKPVKGVYKVYDKVVTIGIKLREQI